MLMQKWQQKVHNFIYSRQFYRYFITVEPPLTTTSPQLLPLYNGHLGVVTEMDDCKKVLKRTQKAALSGTLNIALTFNAVNWDIIECIFNFHVCSFEFSCLHDDIWKKRLSRVLKNVSHWENKTFKVNRSFFTRVNLAVWSADRWKF